MCRKVTWLEGPRTYRSEFIVQVCQDSLRRQKARVCPQLVQEIQEDEVVLFAALPGLLQGFIGDLPRCIASLQNDHLDESITQQMSERKVLFFEQMLCFKSPPRSRCQINV